MTPLSNLSFAVVGDCRPANEDAVSQYPTSIITQIWKDVAAVNPALAVTTGNYMFANPAAKTSTAPTQLGMYLKARANYKGQVFHAMGNNECTGTSSSNCGAGSPDGITPNYQAFMNQMIAPTEKDQPYYVEYFQDPNKA